MGWSFSEVIPTTTDDRINEIWFSGSSISDTVMFEDEHNKLEMRIDDLKKIVDRINYKTNFLNE